MSAQIIRFPSFAKVLRLFSSAQETRRLNQSSVSEAPKASRCEIHAAERLIAANRARIESLRMQAGQLGGIF